MWDELLGLLIEMMACIWSSDADLWSRTLLAESEGDRAHRRWYGLIFGGAMAILLTILIVYLLTQS